jgi:type I restriction enzyme, S subunit
VRKNDVLVAKVGDPPCDAAAYLENQRSIITQDVIRIRPNSETSSSFLVGLINSPIGKRAISRFIIEGTRARVSLTEFKQIRMPRPPYPEQVQMGAVLDSFENKIKNEEQGLLKAILEKQGLANDLLKGSVRVKADEPTHV